MEFSPGANGTLFSFANFFANMLENLFPRVFVVFSRSKLLDDGLFVFFVDPSRLIDISPVISSLAEKECLIYFLFFSILCFYFQFGIFLFNYS